MLSAAAMRGVRGGVDPQPITSDFLGYTSNWVGGLPDALWAYEAWMYDDGPGSPNLDCRPAHRSGCWGHRRDVLWSFGPAGHLAMGVAAADGWRHIPGYAMLIVQSSSPAPGYSYTWAVALAAGADRRRRS